MKSIYILLTIISVFAFSANSIMSRTFQVKLQISKHAINLYQALFTFVAFVAYFILSIAQGVPFSMHIIIPSILFGVFFSCAVLFSTQCMDMGYMSLTSVITNLSLILPVMFSWIIMNEKVELNSIVGLILIIVTLVLASASIGNGNKKSVTLWMMFVIIAFISNGSSAIVQKQYKSSFGGDDLMLFMAFAYLVSSLIFFAVYIIKNAKSDIKIKEQIKNPTMLPILCIMSGLGSFAGNGLLGYLCDKVNGALLYPCINGGLCIVTSIASFLIFKEKLNCKKIVAICIGVLAIVILNI